MNEQLNILTNDQIKGVFFDLYGTLLVFDDFEKANAKWEETFYRLIGEKYNLGLCDVKNLCKYILEIEMEKDSMLGLTTYETKIGSGLEKYGVEIPIEELRKTASETVTEWQKEIRLADDALFVIEKLKKNKVVGLITNFDHTPHVYNVLAETGIDNLFDFVIISDEAGYLKPDPKIFDLALKKSNINRDEAIYIGDNVHDDINGAEAARIKPILISRNSESHYDNISSNSNVGFSELCIINSLSQLL